MPTDHVDAVIARRWHALHPDVRPLVVADPCKEPWQWIRRMRLVRNGHTDDGRYGTMIEPMFDQIGQYYGDHAATPELAFEAAIRKWDQVDRKVTGRKGGSGCPTS